MPAETYQNFPSPVALDRDLAPLKVGDHVSFIMRGFFHPRGQESFGIIDNIDDCGGITIKMIANYKHFLTSKKVGDFAATVYFTHHTYDRARHARIYSVHEAGHELSISIFACYEEIA